MAKNNKKSKNNPKNNSNNKQISKSSQKSPGVKWDLEPLMQGKNLDAWLKIINSDVEKFKKYRMILNEKISPAKILEIIKLEEKISVDLGSVDKYYGLKYYENSNNQDALANMTKLKSINASLSNDMLFFGLWFIHLEDSVAEKIINAPELKEYRYHLKDVRKEKKYTKSEEIEQILNIKNITGLGSFSELYEIQVNNYTYEWNGKKVDKEEITVMIKDPDPEKREKAYKALLGKYTQDNTLLSQIYKNVVLAWNNEGIKIRGYESSIGIRNKHNDVTDKSVQVMFDVVRKNVKVFHEYFKIKYEMNKKTGDKYPYNRYHLYAPLKIKETKKYSYEESKAIVLDAYKKFDGRFYNAAKKIFDDNHVHSHPSHGKQGGAFCMGCSKGVSPYVLLNHTDRLRDVYTMMHEFGHGIHDIFAQEKQPHLVWHASIPMAETASIFSEMVLTDQLLRESQNAEEKKYILAQLLDDKFASIIRQTYFTLFEVYAHEKILAGGTTEELNKKYSELLKEQFGDMTVPEEFKTEWTLLPHMYEYPFYCYAYSWGNLFVLALFDMYKKEGKKFIDKYVELLSAGGNGSPIDLMKNLGADPEDPKFWQRGFDIIKEKIEELKKLR